MGKEQYVRGMLEYFCQERDRVKRFREQAKEEKQARKRVKWQQELPAREYLEHAKCCNDTDCRHRMVKHGLFCFEKWRSGKNTKTPSEMK